MSSKNVQFWFKDLVSNKVKSMPNLKFNEIKQAYRKHEVYYTKVLFTVVYTNRQINALIFCHYKNNNKNSWEMGLLSLSNLEIRKA